MNELKPAARAALQAMGGEDGPSVEDRERLRRRIFGAIALSGATAAASAAFGAQSAAVTGGALGTLKSGLFGAKLGLLGPVAFGLAVGGLVGSAVAISSLFLAERAAPTPAAGASVAHARSPAPSPPATGVATGIEQQASTASPSSSVSYPPPARTTDGAPARATDGAQRVPPRAEHDARTPPPFEEATGHGEPEKPPTRAAVPEATAQTAGIRDELALLEQAHRELSQGNATASLAVLDEHMRRFPSGAFTAERTAARVFALCALGQIDRARAVGEEFLRSAPASPLVPRIRSSCAGQP